MFPQRDLSLKEIKESKRNDFYCSHERGYCLNDIGPYGRVPFGRSLSQGDLTGAEAAVVGAIMDDAELAGGDAVDRLF